MLEITVAEQRRADLRIALWLTWITLLWMCVEGAASLWIGYSARSLLLEAFGVDSILELVSACVLLWRLALEYRGRMTEAETERSERKASEVVGYTLYLLVGLILVSSGYRLLLSHTLTDTHESVWGVAIGIVAKVGMPLLAGWKLQIAGRLNSRALRADAMEAIACGYLSVILIVGLIATRLLNWWWLDSTMALALIPFLVKEGREAVRGECLCH